MRKQIKEQVTRAFRYVFGGVFLAVLGMLLLSCTPLSGVFVQTVCAHNLGESGSCGDNATYTVSGSTLTISGTGAISPRVFNPYYSQNDLSGITTIVIGDGITEIGDSSFAYLDITSVRIPASVTVIGELAFDFCKNLSDVTIAEGSLLTEIKLRAFEHCAFSRIVLPCEGLCTIGQYAFKRDYNRIPTEIICLTKAKLSVDNEVLLSGYGSYVTVYMPFSSKVDWPCAKAVKGLCEVSAGVGISSLSGTKFYGDYYAEGSTLTFTTSYREPDIYFDDVPCSAAGEEEKTVTIPGGLTSDRVALKAIPSYVDIAYIDENGEEKTVNAKVLKSNTGNARTTLDSGWYAVLDDVTIAPVISGEGCEGVTLLRGMVRLVLADGARLRIGTEDNPVNVNTAGIQGDTVFYLYGQTAQTGSLDIVTDGKIGIETRFYYQCGGKVNIRAKGNSGGLKASGGVTVRDGSLDIVAEESDGISLGEYGKSNFGYQQSGGNVSIRTQGSSCDGMFVRNGDINITGGSFFASADKTGSEGIRFVNELLDYALRITFGWTAPTDSIYVNNWMAFGRYDFRIADGQYMTDGTNVYSGSISYLTNGITWRPANFVGTGTEEDPYTIYDKIGWKMFCDCLQDNDTYNRFIGKKVRLAADIGTEEDPVTDMAGSSGHDFMGTFEGQGYTLHVAYGSAAAPITTGRAAPFVNVVDCTIANRRRPCRQAFRHRQDQ